MRLSPRDLGHEQGAGFAEGHGEEVVHERRGLVERQRSLHRTDHALPQALRIAWQPRLQVLDSSQAPVQLPVGPHGQKPVTESRELVASIRV